jgi:hypothetical protein
MFKKMTLLAVAAAAVAAFAIPASASASGMFYDNGKEIKGAIGETFEGPIGFEIPGVLSFECNAHAEVDMETNQGTVTSLEIQTETCVGGGIMTPCTLKEDEVLNAGTLTPTATDIDLRGVEITITYGGGGCPLTHSTMTMTSVKATPDNHNAISTLMLSGATVIHRPGQTSLNVGVTGELEAAVPGTFGLTAF